MSWYQFVYWIRAASQSVWHELKPTEVLQLSGAEFLSKLAQELKNVDAMQSPLDPAGPAMSSEACLIVTKWDPKTSTWRRYVG